MTAGNTRSGLRDGWTGYWKGEVKFEHFQQEPRLGDDCTAYSYVHGCLFLRRGPGQVPRNRFHKDFGPAVRGRAGRVVRRMFEKAIALIALVKFNNGVALVVKEKLNFTYTQHDHIIIGIDDSGTFLQCFYYGAPSTYFKAFGGHEFDITLENGRVIHCNGQWWWGGGEKAEEILNKEIVEATVGDIESLKKCYVYTGVYAIKDKIKKLISGYSGKLYEYREYAKVLKGPVFWSDKLEAEKDLEKLLAKYRVA